MGAVECGATRATYVPPVWSIINAPTSFSAQAWPFGRASTRTSSTLGRRPDTAQPIIGTDSETISTTGHGDSAATNGLVGPADRHRACSATIASRAEPYWSILAGPI